MVITPTAVIISLDSRYKRDVLSSIRIIIVSLVSAFQQKSHISAKLKRTERCSYEVQTRFDDQWISSDGGEYE